MWNHPHLQFLWSELLLGRLAPCWLLIGAHSGYLDELALRVLSKGQHNPEGFSQDLVKRQITLGFYPNYFVLRCLNEATEITVDQIRTLHHSLSHHAAIPGWRVVIIELVDSLNRFASNALLKLCEEPPSQTLILGITHRLGRVIPTLRSRFQKLSFQETQKMDLEALEKIRHLMISAYKGSFDEISFWTKKVQKGDEKNIFKMILENLYQACLKRPQDEKVLNCYANVEAWISHIEGAHLDLSHAVLGCFVKIHDSLKS